MKSTNPRLSRRRVVQGLGAAFLPLPHAFGWAADYPTKPIELVVPASAGGGTEMGPAIAKAPQPVSPRTIHGKRSPMSASCAGSTHADDEQK